MRQRSGLFALVVLAALVAAVAAWAGNPHFLRFASPELVNGSGTASALATASASSSTADPRVLVDEIEVAGVTEGATSRLTAQYQAVYVCVSSTGHVPMPVRQVTLGGQVGADFPAARNGRASGSLLTGPLPTAAEAAAATGFACADGKHVEFDRVVFFDLVLAVDGGETVDFDVTLASASVHGLG